MKITATDGIFSLSTNRVQSEQSTKARRSGKAADHVLAWGQCASFEGWGEVGQEV